MITRPILTVFLLFKSCVSEYGNIDTTVVRMTANIMFLDKLYVGRGHYLLSVQNKYFYSPFLAKKVSYPAM